MPAATSTKFHTTLIRMPLSTYETLLRIGADSRLSLTSVILALVEAGLETVGQTSTDEPAPKAGLDYCLLKRLYAEK